MTDFCAWTIPKGEHLLLGAAIPRRAVVLERFQLLKTKLLARGFDLSRPIKREGCLLLRPRGAGNVLLVGEAAGWISPGSAEGLGYAMRSALALAGAMSDAAPLRGLLARYHAATRGLAANLAGKQVRSLVTYDRRLRRLVMASGLTSCEAPTPEPVLTHPIRRPGKPGAARANHQNALSRATCSAVVLRPRSSSNAADRRGLPS